MKLPFRLSLFPIVFLVFAGGSQAQASKSIDAITRPRSVAALKTASSSKSKFQEPSKQTQTPTRPQEAGTKPSEKTPASSNRQQPDESKATPREESGASRHLSPNRIRARINEATRLMKVRPLPTAMTAPSLEYVTLAALLPETSQIHLIRIPKTTFLTKGATLLLTTSQGLGPPGAACQRHHEGGPDLR